MPLGRSLASVGVTRMAFKTTKGPTVSLESPEAMYQDIRPRKIEGLLSHQADVLRAYAATALEEKDVALQLPTGSGKTLVGLVLGEWRRRKRKERVVYLCPTRQLVNQVVDYSNDLYGIRVNGFTGRQRDYSAKPKGEWLAGEAVAITTYAGLFNANTFFDGAHLLILDDAHAAEGYIADHWSLTIEGWREDQAVLFDALATALKPLLPPDLHLRFTSKPNFIADFHWVDQIPMPLLYEAIGEITSILDVHTPDTDLQWAWALIRDNLSACHLYLSPQQVLIRPLLPPTGSHAPFVRPSQRVYMSATLGEGGELERLAGRTKIKRLPIPAGWDKQGIGRRFFMFPGRSLKDDEVDDLTLDLMKEAGRSLVLVHREQAATDLTKKIESKLHFPTFGAREIEQSKEPFVKAPKAVAVMANRYDGIDFPKDECRLLIVGNLSRATNLQERFLISRMGALALLNERILTRTVQAFGRCTRSATDYSAVTIIGDELLAYLMKREGREFLHPELQAELQFGITQSANQTKKEFLENFRLFRAQGSEWSGANDEIVSLRQGCEQATPPGLPDLRRAVADEVEYVHAMWRQDYLKALEHCRKVLAVLDAPELQGYRALWNYLAAAAAWLASRTKIAALADQAKDYFERAAKAAPNIAWLRSASGTREEVGGALPTSPRLLKVLERLETCLDSLGITHDRNYAREEKFIREGLASSNTKEFEMGHERLGRFLGYDAGLEESSGSPDPWWIVDDKLCFVFEDHSGGDPSGFLDVKKARQAATHPNWVKNRLPITPDAKIVTVLVTPVKKAESGALPHLGEVLVWPLSEFQAWAVNALAVIRELRASFPGTGDIFWRARAAEAYVKHHLDPEGLLEVLQKNVASEMLQPVGSKAPETAK